MDGLGGRIASKVQASGFTPVVRIDAGGATVFVEAYGDADRAHGIPNRTCSTCRCGGTATAGASPPSLIHFLDEELSPA